MTPNLCQAPPNITSFTLPVITGAALVDSINPCAIAVLIILLETLLLTGGKNRALKVAGFFIIGVYLTYLVLGLGLYSALTFLPWDAIAFYFHKILGVLAIIIGLFNIKDFFFYGKGFLMEIPRTWRPKLGTFLHKTTNPLGAFVAGFIFTFFELPCTGGPYIFALGVLAKNVSRMTSFWLLLYYNLIFVLPLIIIAGLIYLGFLNIEHTARWREKNVKLLHFIAGLLMVVLGVWVFLS